MVVADSHRCLEPQQDAAQCQGGDGSPVQILNMMAKAARMWDGRDWLVEKKSTTNINQQLGGKLASLLGLRAGPSR